MGSKSPSKGLISAILIAQLIPLILFPPESFSLNSQEWWLPVLLAVLVVIAVVELLLRHSTASWPWNLMSFAQGVNVISRLMLLWPHATFTSGQLNVLYVSITLLSIVLSVFLLLFMERPDVRMVTTS